MTDRRVRKTPVSDVSANHKPSLGGWAEGQVTTWAEQAPAGRASTSPHALDHSAWVSLRGAAPGQRLHETRFFCPRPGHSGQAQSLGLQRPLSPTHKLTSGQKVRRDPRQSWNCFYLGERRRPAVVGLVFCPQRQPKPGPPPATYLG